jgi:hypothetical protein
MQELLEKRWTPAGVTLPDEQLVPEVIASLIRMTAGNFRLLTRLLTQIERVLSVNNLHRSRRSGTGRPRDWARMTPDTTNNSETLRQIAIKATRLFIVEPAATFCPHARP